MLLNYGAGEGLENPLDNKEIKPVNPNGNQPRVFFVKSDAEGDTLILWQLDAKSQLIGKNSDAGQDWGKGEEGSRGWGSWLASLTQWAWVWAYPGR